MKPTDRTVSSHLTHENELVFILRHRYSTRMWRRPSPPPQLRLPPFRLHYPTHAGNMLARCFSPFGGTSCPEGHLSSAPDSRICCKDERASLLSFLTFCEVWWGSNRLRCASASHGALHDACFQIQSIGL